MVAATCSRPDLQHGGVDLNIGSGYGAETATHSNDTCKNNVSVIVMSAYLRKHSTLVETDVVAATCSRPDLQHGQVVLNIGTGCRLV